MPYFYFAPAISSSFHLIQTEWDDEKVWNGWNGWKGRIKCTLIIKTKLKLRPRPKLQLYISRKKKKKRWNWLHTLYLHTLRTHVSYVPMYPTYPCTIRTHVPYVPMYPVQGFVSEWFVSIFKHIFRLHNSWSATKLNLGATY